MIITTVEVIGGYDFIINPKQTVRRQLATFRRTILAQDRNTSSLKQLATNSRLRLSIYMICSDLHGFKRVYMDLHRVTWIYDNLTKDLLYWLPFRLLWSFGRVSRLDTKAWESKTKWRFLLGFACDQRRLLLLTNCKLTVYESADYQFRKDGTDSLQFGRKDGVTKCLTSHLDCKPLVQKSWRPSIDSLTDCLQFKYERWR